MVSGFAHCQMRFEGEWPADFRYLAVNPAFEALTGLHGVVGRWVSEAIPGIRERDPGLLGVPQQTCNQGQSSPTLLF